ncbi:hypothetical protein SAMN04488500_101133 [Sporomusa malonica]|uniref:Uncharacterized protein n=1 Tax=Sporomusa malonica TaxID=112901 RepID=A0A1W1Y9X9_9FIRM|nr:hypothetical protein SAMN04488500_101133 [Sporomusa malonica]
MLGSPGKLYCRILALLGTFKNPFDEVSMLLVIKDYKVTPYNPFSDFISLCEAVFFLPAGYR